MKVTEKLRVAIRNLLDHANGEVGLIVRWNEDDSTIETVWSEKYDTFDGVKKLGFNRKPITRLDAGKCGYVDSISQPELGGHAEEIMIRNWDAYKKYNNLLPKVVDIIITHSPCSEESGIYRDANGKLWPAGCSKKLYHLINEVETNVSHWNIAYFRYYGKKEQEARAVSALHKLDSHPKVLLYHFHGIP